MPTIQTIFQTHLIAAAIGFIIGMIVTRKYWRPGVDTDYCSQYLNKQGYTVHLRTKDR